jgi:uncharacterized protein (TIGR03437 family)
MISMRAATISVVFLTVLCAAPAPAQVLSNSSLTGKYFARHIEFTTDTNNIVTDARSIIGAIAFDGAGNYSFNGQQVIGTGVAATFTVSGTYAMNSAGMLTLTNPQKTAATINARFGSEAVIGSSTEIAGNTFDLFAAIPAPTKNITIAGVGLGWNAADFELTAGSIAQVRDSFVQFALDGAGNVTSAAVKGHAANYNTGVTVNQTIGPGNYSVNGDGTGTITFPNPSGVSGAGAMMGAAPRMLTISQTGNVLLAATPGGHDILIAILAPTGTVTPAPVWQGGIRVDSSGYSDSYIGSQTVIPADSAFVGSRRLHEATSATPINYTTATLYTLATDGTGSAGSSRIAVGTTALVAANVGSLLDPTGYEIAFGEILPPVSGTGVFVNPQGVVNAASNSPVGNPVSPGEFIAIYGSGLAAQTMTATPPYPNSLGNVSVSIGGLPAPVYLVSSGQLNCLVPYAVPSNSASVTIAVTSNGQKSNTVTVPFSATAPGIFSDNTSGTGDGAILHSTTNLLVTPANPATKGETLVMYLTGLGSVQNRVTDGAAPNPPAADNATAQVVVYVNGIAVTPGYAGLNPVYPGLYQINFVVPATLTVSGELPLAVQTPDSFHDQINLSVQ